MDSNNNQLKHLSTKLTDFRNFLADLKFCRKDLTLVASVRMCYLSFSSVF